MRKMPTTRAGNADLCLRKVHDELLSDSVVGGRGDDGVIGARAGLDNVDGRVQVELALPRLCLRQESLDLVVLDGRLEAVDLLDLLGHDVQRVHLIVLQEQDGEGQADVAGTGDSDLHAIALYSCLL